MLRVLKWGEGRQIPAGGGKWRPEHNNLLPEAIAIGGRFSVGVFLPGNKAGDPRVGRDDIAVQLKKSP